MLRRIFTLKNFLSSLARATIFLVFFYLLKLVFYYFGWEEKDNFDVSGFIIYFILIFLMYFILDGRDYTWKDVLTFKKIKK
ncbi:hypothetical protein SAMN05421796_101691 [Chryseobacterium piscicola]|jgi:hypothetical protein|uniref:Uncharacterized protein n=1 Tax=Chryseobacterium piscicola TaxID=551459 RepID=A0A1N7KN13_9FLAO|nr:hypothetical protein B0A70_13160 [Chryseobacterium piscicola]SIS62934.1 hypothetical protein SAMN05421796_101691 [Chryseobacterium piscicola]